MRLVNNMIRVSFLLVVLLLFSSFVSADSLYTYLDCEGDVVDQTGELSYVNNAGWISFVTDIPSFNISGDNTKSCSSPSSGVPSIYAPTGAETFFQDSFTISFWWKGAYNEAGRLFQFSDSSNAVIAYAINYLSKNYALYDAVSVINQGTVIGDWHYMTIIRNGTSNDFSLYQNTLLLGSVSTTDSTKVLDEINWFNRADLGKPQLNSFGDEMRIYDYALSLEEMRNLYNYNSLSPPSPPSSDEAIENTAVVRQVGSVNVNSASLSTVISSDFDVDDDNTSIYGVYTFNVLSNTANLAYCELDIDGVVVASKSRSNVGGDIGSVTLSSEVFVADAGTHTQTLKCSKSGAGGYSVFNAVGVGHFLVDEAGGAINHISGNVSATTSSDNFSLIGVANFTLGNYTGSDLQNFIIVEGALEYENTGVSDNVFSTYISIDDSINCSSYPRTVSAGGSGSVGVDCVFRNATSNSTYEIKLYGSGVDASFTGNIIAKQFFMDPIEIIGGSGATVVGSNFSGSTPVKLFNTTGGNLNHLSANAFNKLSYSLYSDVETDVIFYTKLVNGDTFISNNFTRTINSDIGVLNAQDVFLDVAQDNYSVELWAVCPAATCFIAGGTSLGYLTDITVTTLNSFNVTAYNIFSNVSISNFSVVNGLEVSTTDGVVTYFSGDDFINLTVVSDGFYNYSVLNHNTSLDLNVSLTPLYYFVDNVFSGYNNYSGVGYSNNVSYDASFVCPVGVSATAYVVVDGVVFTSFSPVCNGNVVSNVGSFIYSFEGLTDVFINWSETVQVSDTLSVVWDLFQPDIVQSFVTGEGFNSPDVNITVACFDDVSPLLNYNVSWEGVVLNVSDELNSTVLSFTETVGLDNSVYTVCTDLAGNVRENNYSETLYFTVFSLINERNGSLFDVANLSSVVVYIDDSTSSYDLKGAGVSNFSFLSTGSDVLRFEYIYPDGFVVNRYFDMSLTRDTVTRFCAIPDDGFEFYEQIIVSSVDSTRVTFEAGFADCVVLSDSTRFAYQNAFAIRTFTIDTTYILYNYLSNTTRSILASIDGGIEAFMNVDSLVFSSSAFNQGLRAESLSVKKFSGTTMLIVYNNTNVDNSDLEIVITRTDTGAVVYTEDEFDNVNEVILYYDFSTVVGLTNSTLFKVAVNTVRNDGTTNSFTRYFNTAGNAGLLHPSIAFLFVFLMLIFGITFPTASDAFAWFGLLATIGNLGIIASSVLTTALGFLLAVNGVVMIYIIFILVNQTSQRVAT